jgi:hypothetical protein
MGEKQNMKRRFNDPKLIWVEDKTPIVKSTVEDTPVVKVEEVKPVEVKTVETPKEKNIYSDRLIWALAFFGFALILSTLLLLIAAFQNNRLLRQLLNKWQSLKL